MIVSPYPSLVVRFTIAGITREAVALVDSGFDGYLSIPRALATSLPNPGYGRRIQTASGERVRVPSFLATLELIDVPGSFNAYVISVGDEFLLGLLAMNRFRVTFDHGRRLILEP